MKLKEISTEEILELVGKKRLEIMELIENIDEQTGLKCYGTIIIDVENKDKSVYSFGGGSGGILDIAKLFNSNSGLMSIVNIAFFHNACKGDQHDE